jgi:hypothetical protein
MSDSTPLRPEQVRALSYIREKGTEAPAAALRQRLAETFAGLEALLDEIPESEVRRRPGPDRWSVQEIVDHLVESHRPAVEHLRALLQGRRPEGGPIPASLLSAAPMARPWPELAGELKKVHADFLAVLESAPGDDPGTVKAPVLMVIKVQEPDGSTVPLTWTEELDWKAQVAVFRVHTLEHRGQIERTLGAIRGG